MHELSKNSVFTVGMIFWLQSVDIEQQDPPSNGTQFWLKYNYRQHARMHERSKNSVFTVGLKICILQLMELGNIGIAIAETRVDA